MNDNFSVDDRLLNGPLSSSGINFSRLNFGLIYSFFKTREKTYFIYFSFFIFSFSVFFIFGERFDVISLVDKFLSFLPVVTNDRLFILFLFVSFVVFLFGFTLYSNLINSLSFLLLGSLAGVFSRTIFVSFDIGFVLDILFASVCSFLFLVFSAEARAFSKCITSFGISTKRINDIIHYSLVFVFCLLIIIFLKLLNKLF